MSFISYQYYVENVTISKLLYFPNELIENLTIVLTKRQCCGLKGSLTSLIA